MLIHSRTIYGFPAAVVAIMLITHIPLSDCRDTSGTVLHLHPCVTSGT